MIIQIEILTEILLQIWKKNEQLKHITIIEDLAFLFPKYSKLRFKQKITTSFPILLQKEELTDLRCSTGF
jgi:hypothetical protein